ncbi:nucleolar protein 10 [Neocloeon triangulifer]|uniref:nucleolar protein 10 n=1 Tax=Neocloeon triangulifer TaxID=2078957 RepID=UPI00286EC9A3|nr:nucleolar protein 10 [Neocloeon triangulifer]
MIVSDLNNVKIYNLSAGKSLPEWLAERKKSKSSWKKSTEYQRQIELIQEFDMPAVSTTVKMSPDAQFILATGIYKPRVKCFDVNNLALKFERCFDSEAITFEILSDDYSKIAFLQCDRYIEFHAGFGRYFRLRVPKFGRDMTYHTPSCDLYVCGSGSDIYRLNLERGQFMTPLVSDATEFNCGATNSQHHLMMFGSKEGKVEAWDPRSRTNAMKLDCAFSCAEKMNDPEAQFPSVTALKFKDGLHFGVGTASGQVLLYDLRSSRPLLIKDHMYGLPIKCLEFHAEQNMALSLDSSVLKIWNCDNGNLFTSIEPGVELNQFSVIPKSGMMFIANENPKILTYYIPSLGPAPRWCGFLDRLTEELEESNHHNIYDDYKFITSKEAEDLGFSNLIGTNLMRAYMHGYFIDNRLYRKAKALVEPFAFQEYRRKKIKEKIEETRANRVKMPQKLPQINKDLAIKLLEQGESEGKKKKKQAGPSLLGDDRFKALFENADYEVDTTAEAFRLINPVVSKLDNKKAKKKVQAADSEEEDIESDDDGREESSSDDEHTWTKEVKKQHKLIKRERLQRAREEEMKKPSTSQPKMYELRAGEEFKWINKEDRKRKKASLGERLKGEESNEVFKSFGSSREMSFSTRTRKVDRELKAKQRLKNHHEERRKLQRSVRGLRLKPIPGMSGPGQRRPRK